MKEENSKTKKTTAKTKTNKSTKTVVEKKSTTLKATEAAKPKKKTSTNTVKSKDANSKKTTTKKSNDTKTKSAAVKKVPVKKEEIKEEKVVEKKETITTENNTTKTIIIAILVVLLLGVLFFISEKNNTKFVQPETFSEEEQADLNNINVDDYLSLKAGSDVSVIYIARPTCSHCVTQTPRMKYIKYKYGVEINYLNTDEFDQEGTDYEKLASSDSFFDEGFGTPTTLIVQNDKIVDSVSGESEISNLVQLFKKYNLIKE